MSDCVFCEIIDGGVSSHVVYEDERVIAFLDANPASRGHTLVVPKQHVEDIHGARGMEYLWDVLVAVSDAVDESLDPAGINIAQNNGVAAGQEVFHLHFHVTPIYDGDELRVSYDRSDLVDGEDVANLISSNI